MSAAAIYMAVGEDGRAAPDPGTFAVLAKRLAGAFNHQHGGDEKGPGPEPGGSVGRFRVSMLKPATYSVMHLVVAVSVAYALTRDWRIALGVGIVEPLVQTVAYTVHEHLWAKVKH